MGGLNVNVPGGVNVRLTSPVHTQDPSHKSLPHLNQHVEHLVRECEEAVIQDKEITKLLLPPFIC